MVTVTSVNDGDKLLVSLDKQALKLLPEVANHPALSNEANWGKVSVVLKDTSSIKRLVAAFTGDFTQPDYVTPKMTKKDQFFQLHKIVISSPTRSTILAIKKDQVPNSSSVSIAMQKDTAYGSFTYPRVSITSSEVYTVSGTFKVNIAFTEVVNGFSSEDVTVTNGVAQQLYTTSNPLVYEADIVPTSSGQVIVQVSTGVAISSTDLPNVASNRFIIQYTPQVSTDGYRHYKFSAKDGWLNDSQITKIGINCIKLFWDDSIQKLDQSFLTYLKQPTYSDKHLFDDTVEMGKSIYWNLSQNTYEDLFKIDLGQKRNVTSLLIRPQSTNPFHPKTFKFYGSDDGQNWTEVLSVSESNILDEAFSWGDFNDRYHKEFIIKNKQNESVLTSSSNWSSSSSWIPNTVPNSSQQTAILFSGNAISQNTLNLDENVTINKLFIKPKRASWSIFTNNQKSIAFSGTNSRIVIAGESYLNLCNIQVPIVVDSEIKISTNTDAEINFSGKIISNNKDLTLEQNVILNPKMSFSNQTNDITGKIILDSANVEIKNASSTNCILDWSNKKAMWTAFWTINGIQSAQKLSVLSNSPWSGSIVFKNDGNNIYSIQNDQLTSYSGSLSGSIANGLHLKNCALNQSSNSITYNPNNKIYISEGVVEWNNYNALPLGQIHFGETDFCESAKPIIFRYPVTQYGTGREISYSGPSLWYFSNSPHLTLQLNNSQIGSINLIKSPVGQDVSKKIIYVVGSGTISNFTGDGSDTKIKIGGINEEVIFYNHINLPANKCPTIRVETNAKTKVLGQSNIPFEVFAGGTLGVVDNGQVGNVTSIAGSDVSHIYGNGSIQGNLTLTDDCTLSPLNIENIAELQYIMMNRSIWDEGLTYGMKIYGNFICSAGSKIYFNFTDNFQVIYYANEVQAPPPNIQTGEATRITVYGDVTLGGTIEVKDFHPMSGTTSILLTYTGTRTGTFTNNLGPNTVITYDDANKRVLVTAN